MYYKFALLTLLACCFATPPPGYVKPPETDKYPPKYEYGYKIEDNKGSGQGKLETRDGDFSAGRYYVQLGDGASQNVQYFTDEWGYHPLVEYSSMGDHSQASAQFALGEKAVEALKKNTAASDKNRPVATVSISSTTARPTTIASTPTPEVVKPVNEPQQKESVVDNADNNNGKQPVEPEPSNIVPSSSNIVSAPNNIITSPAAQPVQLMHNIIPVQYVVTTPNIPDAQYVLQPQKGIEMLPEAQYLIQSSNAGNSLTHPQFLVPVYQTQPNENLPGKQRLLVNDLGNNIQQDTTSNSGLEKEKQQSEDLQQGAVVEDSDVKEQGRTETDNTEESNTDTGSSQSSRSENENFSQNKVPQNLPQQQYNFALNNYHKESNLGSRTDYSNIQSASHNNGQYLVEIKHPSSSQNGKDSLQNEGGFSYRAPQINEYAQQGKTYQQQIEEIEREISKGQAASEKENSSAYEQALRDIETEALKLISEAARDENIRNNIEYKNDNEQIQNTEALFGNTVSEVRYNADNNYKVERTRERAKYNENNNNFNLESFGNFGARIKVKPPTYVKNNNKNNEISASLIDRTKNLVTGVDVLNINDAVSTTGGEIDEQKIKFEENKNAVTDYSNIQYANSYPGFISDVNAYLLGVDEENKSRFHQGQTVSKTVLIPKVVEGDKINEHIEAQQELQNARNKLLEILNSEKVVPVQEDRVNFARKPIVVADLEAVQENTVQSTTEDYQEQSRIAETVYSTTQSTVETKTAENGYQATEDPVLITPRPVSNTFLAPITAAVNLQNSKQDLQERNENSTSDTYIQIQKSVPYYIGKVEYLEKEKPSSNSHNFQYITAEQFENLKGTNIFGASINSQIQETIQDLSQKTNIQIDEDFLEDKPDKPKQEALVQGNNNDLPQDQIQEQGQSIQQGVSLPYENNAQVFLSQEEKRVSDSVTKLYPVDKQIVQVEKIVEKPVQVTRVVEKPVPVHIPQPYPVEVERIVEKQIRVPVEVTRYVDKPYPVHVPYPQPVAIPVEVERVVETVVKEPYPVKVAVPVEVPVKVPVPQPIQVTKYIEKPVPVEKIVEKPYPVEKIVEKQVPQYIETPYPVPVHVAVPHPVAVPVEVQVPQPYPVEVTKYIEKPYGVPQPYAVHVPKAYQYIQHIPVAVPVTKLVKVPVEVPKYIDRLIDRPYPIYVNLHQQQPQQQQQKFLQNPYLYAPRYQIDLKNLNCDQKKQQPQQQQAQQSVKQLQYIGLVPPLKPANDFNSGHQSFKRKARNSFGQNLRIEYGFKPPIIPSVQTDEFGMPLNPEDQK